MKNSNWFLAAGISGIVIAALLQFLFAIESPGTMGLVLLLFIYTLSIILLILGLRRVIKELKSDQPQ